MEKTVITYGTFDLFHNGHYALLERAKKLGNFLIVGVTSDNYDKTRGKLNVKTFNSSKYLKVPSLHKFKDTMADRVQGWTKDTNWRYIVFSDE
jgi:cytidyltransferase-like protein